MSKTYMTAKNLQDQILSNTLAAAKTATVAPRPTLAQKITPIMAELKAKGLNVSQSHAWLIAHGIPCSVATAHQAAKLADVSSSNTPPAA